MNAQQLFERLEKLVGREAVEIKVRFGEGEGKTVRSAQTIHEMKDDSETCEFVLRCEGAVRTEKPGTNGKREAIGAAKQENERRLKTPVTKEG